MRFELREEHRMIRDMVRDFARTEIEPGVEERERKGEFPHEMLNQAAELGLCGVTVPEKYGGAGLDSISLQIALMETAAVCPATALSLSVHNGVFCYPVLKFGTEEQKDRFLRPAAGGEFLGAFCLSEPDAGSDASNLIVKAVEDGVSFVIEGTKAWVTHGGLAGAYIVMAVTGGAEKRKEISSFIVPAETPGLSVGKIEDKMGMRSSRTTQIVFDGCRVPRELMLGGRGEGLKIALATLDESRIGIAAQSVGLADGAMEEALKYSQERTAFGKPLAAHQAIGFMLADMATEIAAARLLTFRAAWLLDQGLPFSKESAMAKYYASETAKRVTDRALQIHGSYGYCKEYKVERLYRDARILTIYEGTSEVMKIVMSRNMLK
jgi:butyryl-CoA dehydrogenase